MAFATENERQKLREMVALAASGNEAAFGQIYDLFFDRVYRFVFYRVNHQETAEDLTAEVFIRVWSKIAKIGDAGAFGPWVFQIARNLVIDYYRTRKSTVDLQELENIIPYEDQAVDMVNLHYDQQRFLAGLKKLSADQQVVLKLKFIDELENDEIAGALGKSEGAIRVIQHRGLLALKEFFNNNNQEKKSD